MTLVTWFILALLNVRDADHAEAKRLAAADIPHRIKYKKLVRA